MDTLLLRHFFSAYPELKPSYRKFESALIASKKRKNQKYFLTRCLEEQVCPSSFGFQKHGNVLGHRFPDYIRSFLQDRIKIASLECDNEYLSLRKAARDIKFVCPDNVTYNHVVRFAYRKADNIMIQHRARLDQKLIRLCNNSVWGKFSLTENVVNLSDRVLSKYETELLGLGLNFALKPVKNNVMDYIVNFDKYIAANDYNSELLCLKGVLLQGIKDCFKDESGLPRRYQLAMENLKKSDNIILTKADKGGKIVILNSTAYSEKALSLLSDTVTYEKLTKNPLKSAAAEFNRKVRNIAGNKKTVKLLEEFKVINPCLPNFYGLPKIHKPGVPLRPIISIRGSFSSKLSKWLSKLLSPLIGTFSNSHIRHTEDFIAKIRNLNCHDVKLLSLDVESLFTKVPIDDVLEFLESKLSESDYEFPIPVPKIIALVRLCVSTNVFSFQDVFYKQKYGCSMGSNLSPVLANLYMEYFESVLLPQIKHNDMIWFRYVDDVFTTWNENWGSFDQFFNKLNNLVPSINFKVEWETDGKLPFLDCLICRDNGKLTFSVYRKQTHSGSYLHYYSHHSVQVKRSVASGLYLRALRICSPQFLQQEICTVTSQLKNLGYPVWFLDKALSVAKSNYYKTVEVSVKEYCNRSIIKLPYNEAICNLSRMLPIDKVNVIPCYPNTMYSNLVNVHQKPKKTEKPGVYSIPCKDCNKVYVGQTGRNLSERVREHKFAIRYAQENSALFKHVSVEGHSINWDNSRLLYNSHCSFRRKIVESALIKEKPNFNISRGQWSPDLISSVVVGHVLTKTGATRLPGDPPTGHVT